ncbi:Ribosomal protein L7/L12 C-terminal domain family protein [Leishmania donovani]|uniref:Ribosomal protein L7/L12 C-terminal domain family protein n=1 Tax=Leishmania donovani TaxID=5661 RepID=A0A504XMF0_LEIDO|nr:Ribosomal protein L7/L12 C-terminal domain family protein [Leishmania donovani]
MRRALIASGLMSRCTLAHRYCSTKPAGDNAKIDDLATAYSQLTLREVSDLQRLIFKKLGHSDEFYEKALLRDALKTEKKKVEKLTYDVKLEKFAPEIKIKLIKELRTVTNLSIADAKKAVEKCPGLVATNMSKDDAEKLKGLYEKLGAKVELL